MKIAAKMKIYNAGDVKYLSKIKWCIYLSCIHKAMKDHELYRHYYMQTLLDELVLIERFDYPSRKMAMRRSYHETGRPLCCVPRHSAKHVIISWEFRLYDVMFDGML